MEKRDGSTEGGGGSIPLSKLTEMTQSILEGLSRWKQLETAAHPSARLDFPWPLVCGLLRSLLVVISFLCICTFVVASKKTHEIISLPQAVGHQLQARHGCELSSVREQSLIT